MVGMLPTEKTPEMLNKSASFNGVSGAYLCLLLIIGAEFSKMMVFIHTGKMIPEGLA